MGWGWPHGRVDRRDPFPSQPAAGKPVGRQAGVQRAGSCDHKPGNFLATRFGKGQPDCLLRLQREGVSAAQRNSCLVPLVYSQTLEQEGVSRGQPTGPSHVWGGEEGHPRRGGINESRTWVLQHQHLVPWPSGEVAETQL